MNYTAQQPAPPPTSLVTPVSSSTSSIAENGVLASTNQQSPAPQDLPTNGGQELPSLPGSSSTPHHPIAEFLYQLTKMLTDNNKEIIEWTGGKIKVHYPGRLEGEVLHKYFRHSKFASFQRQLNYFGFRKIAGKGKMSPCSYVNDAATADIRSLLMIKRKTNGSAARKAAMAQRAAAAGSLQGQMGFGAYGAMPMSADFLKQALMANPAAQQSMGVYPGMMTLDAQQQAALRQAAFQQQALHAAAAQQQKPLGESLFLPSDTTLAAFAQGQRKLSVQDLGALSKQSGLQGSLEQLQQLSAARNSALNLAGYGMTPGTSHASFAAFAGGWPGSSASLAPMAAQYAMQPAPAPGQSGQAPAAAAPPAAPPASGAMPAAAAMNATAALNAAASNPGNSNLFESNSALTALVNNNNAPAPGDAQKAQGPTPGNYQGPTPGNYQGPTPGNYQGPTPGSYQGPTPGNYQMSAPAPGMMYGGAPGSAAQALQQRISSSNLLRGLPSAGTMFPDSLSSVSLSGLMPGVAGMSSNRLNSMLSLSSFLSRDPSMADLMPGSSTANLASLSTGAPLGNTTLVPLTGQHSVYPGSQYGGASAALSSLMNAAGPAGAALAASFAHGMGSQYFGAPGMGYHYPGAPGMAPQQLGAPAPGMATPALAAPASAPAAAATTTAPAPGFEPTPMMDMGNNRQKFAAQN
jgi:hypothetical protein